MGTLVEKKDLEGLNVEMVLVGDGVLDSAAGLLVVNLLTEKPSEDVSVGTGVRDSIEEIDMDASTKIFSETASVGTVVDDSMERSSDVFSSEIRVRDKTREEIVTDSSLET